MMMLWKKSGLFEIAVDAFFLSQYRKMEENFV